MDGYRHASVTLIRRAKIRKKNREEVERVRDTIAFAYQAMANARQLIKEAAEIFQYNQARREHKAEQGQRQEDITQMRHSHITPLAPYGSAEAYRKGGQGKKGVARLTEALDFVNDTGWRHSGAEVSRVRGPLTLQAKDQDRRSKVEEATEAYFLKTIEIEQSQQAKSWELRAAMSLARLWQQQGRKAEAHELLSDIYRRFPEGFDNKDLQEAKALLEELV
jgi:hypothetical protein